MAVGAALDVSMIIRLAIGIGGMILLSIGVLRIERRLAALERFARIRFDDPD